MIVPSTEIKIVLGKEATDNAEDDLIGYIHNGIEGIVKQILGRDPESTSYTRLMHGSGTTKLLLEEYPVTALTKVSTSFQSVIEIKNTSSDASNAYFSVDSDSLDLEVVGGANKDSTSLAFTGESGYETLSALVIAINAVVKGWTAAVMDSDYNDLETTGLLEEYNVYCGAAGGNTAIYQYIYWGEPLEGVRLDPDAGIIYCASGFPKGFLNVFVTYTAGYGSTSSQLAAIKLAVMKAVKALYDRHGEDGWGVADFSIGALRAKYIDVFAELETELQRYVDVSKLI